MPLPIFGKSQKNPADVVRSLKEALVVLESKSTNTLSETAGIKLYMYIQLRAVVIFGIILMFLTITNPQLI